MTAVAATSAIEIAPAPVRNGPGKPRQGQSSAQDGKEAASKGVAEPGTGRNARTAGAETVRKSGCAGAEDGGLDNSAGASFDDAMLDSATDTQVEQKASMMPPVVAAGVTLPKSDEDADVIDVDAAATVNGHGTLRSRADWRAVGGLVAGAERDVPSPVDGGNVASDDLSATVFDPIRSLKLESPDASTDRSGTVDQAATPVEPKARIHVVSQEAHWNFASSPQRLSSRTAETLAVAGSTFAPSRLQAQLDGKPLGGGMVEADLSAPAPAIPTAQSGPRGGNAAGEGGAGQSESNGNRQTSANGTDFVQQYRRSAAVKSDSATAVAQAGFATEGVKSPAQQVTDAIVNSTQQTAATAGASANVSPNGVLRRLDIKLDPGNLGEVQVKLSLNSNALTIDLSTANAETAKLLSQDRQHIDAGLRRAGYELVDYSVSVATNDATAAAVTAASAASDARPSTGQNGGGSATSQQSQFANAASGGSNERGSGRNDFGQPPRQQTAERTSRDTSAAVTPQGGIYV